MYIFKILVILVLCLVSSLCHAQEPEADYLGLSDALFPEARDWQNIAATPTISSEELIKLKSQLEDSFDSTNFVEKSVCTTIAIKAEQASSFHVIDINHDGQMEVIYVGYSNCMEGKVSVIWYKTLSGYAIKHSRVYQGELLRFSPDGNNATAVHIGCCADDQDQYFLGQLETLGDGDGGITLLKRTAVPTILFDQARPFSTRGRTATQRRPEIIDSRSSSCAEYSDINGKYFGNSRGIALGSTDDGARQWVFVKMQANSNDLIPDCDYDGIRAGWIAMDGIQFFK